MSDAKRTFVLLVVLTCTITLLSGCIETYKVEPDGFMDLSTQRAETAPNPPPPTENPCQGRVVAYNLRMDCFPIP